MGLEKGNPGLAKLPNLQQVTEKGATTDQRVYLNNRLNVTGHTEFGRNVHVSLGDHNSKTTLTINTDSTPDQTELQLEATSRTLILVDKGISNTSIVYPYGQQAHATGIFVNTDRDSIYGAGMIHHDGDDFTLRSLRGGYSFEVPAQFAQGTMTLTGIPSADETFVINGTTVTAKADGSGDVDHFTIGGTATATVTNIVATIAAGSESANVRAWDGAGDTVVFEWGTAGVAGNAIVFTEALSNCTIDGSGTLGATHAGVAAATLMTLEENGITSILGGEIHNVTTVAAATYDLLISDYILNVTYTGTGAVTSLTLPTAQTTVGRVIEIKDAGRNASVNNITIDTEASQTIEGAATQVLSTDGEWIKLYCDGTNWHIRG